MNNLVVRKIAVSIVLALLAPLVLAFSLKALLTDPAGMNAVTAVDNLDITLLYAVVAGIFFVTAFLSAQAMPARRRRNRSSGTVVESDVEDGRERGMVKWFNVKKGFGFITWDDGEDVFVHFRSIRGQGHRSLTEGQRVKFNVVRGQKGPQAEDVSVVRS